MAGKRIIIIGGGFAGASAAVQLVRKIAGPIDIAIVEPAAEIGPGLAYSSDDPAFRLNAISGAHSIDVADPAHFTRWCEQQGLAANDPAALVPNGELFVRRRDFRRYLVETVAAHAAMNNGSRIRHIRSIANALSLSDDGVAVQLDDGTQQTANAAILAVGNPPLRRPRWAQGSLVSYHAAILDPLRQGLSTIGPEDAVLVVGAGLTALDMIASLLARGHRGRIAAISRRGLRPHAQAPRILAAPAAPPEPPVVPLDLLEGPLPDYLANGELNALQVLRGMRRHAAETAAEGLGWQAAFDAVSFPLSRIWPRMPLAEKQRALRHLRPFYDAHRFRTPPMTDARVRQAEDAGQVAFRKASLGNVSVQPDGRLCAVMQVAGRTVDEDFDALINCTGFESAAALDEGLLGAMHSQGMVQAHPTGLGILTDADNCIVTATGESERRIRAIGPVTAGVFGDPLGAFFISAQVHRLIPDLARDLQLEVAGSAMDRVAAQPDDSAVATAPHHAQR